MSDSAQDPKQKAPSHLPQRQWGTLIIYIVFTLVTVWMWQEGAKQGSMHNISYSEFKTALKAGEVTECSVRQDDIVGKIQPKKTEEPEAREKGKKASPAPSPKPPAAYYFRTERVDDAYLEPELEKANVKFTGEHPGVLSEFIWSWLLPIGIIFFLWQMFSRRMSGVKQSILSFGASKARLVAEQETSVTFDDVAGCDEAKYELQEVVGFLKDPTRYRALGAVIPKGVLLVGPPGTGKTLLARAVAGEAGTPFFSISGSEFVEMFVGVGAARVRDLFEKAKAQAPCIVFIDELDAVGRQRGVMMGAVNDEREQTLNQLLVGMDGFEANVGVVILAATNRPEVLDRALLRPGRFDRQVVVDAPDLDGRVAILRLHQRGKPIGDDADLRKIAQETPGFSGADLANLMNEAALLAARRGVHAISQVDLQEAVEKVVAGPERRSRRLSQKDRRLVACHETGHALVAAFTGHIRSVHKISIVPRGHAALGYTLQLPDDDQFLQSKGELLDKIKGLLGGRAAEEVVFDEITTGAENDLDHATALARQMVCVFGMSTSVGLVHCAQKRPQFVAPLDNGAWQRDCSDETAHVVDEEVKQILDNAYGEAKQILRKHRDKLDLIAGELLEKETLDAPSFQKLLDVEPPRVVSA
ncbi:MAG TPA: ATP-dependent zinc metalloprotease FtsH [Chthoniobacteraceae bacterium]|jgi:cell division protease FtsH|nr:ATP-dependent zinc metalloprotease FtsH [Chthoniobacteraceae bacterium]